MANRLRCLSYRNNGAQRCDAQQPCTTCIQFGGGSDCVYEQIHDNSPTDFQPFLSSFKCGPNTRGPCPSVTDTVLPEAGSSLPTSTYLTWSLVSPERSRRRPKSDPPEQCPAPQKQSSTETQLVPSRDDFPKPHQPNDTLTLPFSPSLRFPPVPLNVSFPLINPERFQISDTHLCDAKQPCTTCVNKNKGAACEYEGSRNRDNALSKRPTPTPKGVLLVRSNSNASGSRLSSSPDFRERPLAQPEQSRREPPPTTHGKLVPVPSSDASVAVRALGAMEYPLHPIVSSFSILPSINFQSTTRPLQTPLSLIPPNVCKFPGFPETIWI